MICLYVNFWDFWLIPFRFMMKKDHSKEKCYLGFNSPLSIFGYNFVIFEHNFVILKFYCFILPLNLIPLWVYIASSEGLSRYGSSISHIFLVLAYICLCLFLVSFLVKISSIWTALALPAMIVLQTLLVDSSETY